MTTRTGRGLEDNIEGAVRHRRAGLERIPLLLAAIGVLFGMLSGCSSGPTKEVGTLRQPDMQDAVPKVEPRSRYGNPASYVVFGKRYYTKSNSNGHVERGLASWYGPGFHGRKTSSGERYDMNAMTAAHKTLPLPTYARVTNLDNGKSAVVRINDRGPFHGPRIIDLSRAAAVKLGVVRTGTAHVEVEALDPTAPASTEPNPFLIAANKPAPTTPQPFLDGFDGSPSRQPSSTPVVRTQSVKHDTALAAAEARPEPSRAPATPPARKLVVARTSAPKPASDSAPRTASKGSAGDKPAMVLAAAETKDSSTKLASGAVYVQVGAFGNRSNAEHLRSRLAKDLARLQVQVRSVGGSPSSLYKVQVGPLQSRAKVSDITEQLAALGVTQSHLVVE